MGKYCLNSEYNCAAKVLLCAKTKVGLFSSFITLATVKVFPDPVTPLSVWNFRLSLIPEISSLIDLIGNTPLVQVKSFDTGSCNLFLKMENMNPGSSIKDRVALKIIEDAEKSGELNSGSTIVEATAGNTGLGLALIAKLKGYKAKVVILDKMNENKIFHLNALGAEVFKARR